VTVDYDQMAHPCDEDKDGMPVSNDVAVAVMELRDCSDAYRVLCAWHVSGRIQFFAEGPTIEGEVVRAARDCGYALDHATTRSKDGRKRGYAEFVPEEHTGERNGD
jgi:hypothetical protein